MTITRWLSTMSSSTACVYRRAITRFELFVGCDLRQVDVVDAKAWAQALAADYAPATVRTYLAACSSFYDAQGWKNPFESVDRPESQPELRRLSAAELCALVSRLDRSTIQGARDYAMIGAALYAGLRTSEIAGLRWCELSELPGAATAAVMNYRRIYEGSGYRVRNEAAVFVSTRYTKRGMTAATVRRALSVYGVSVAVLNRTGVSVDPVAMSRAMSDVNAGGVCGRRIKEK